MNKLHVIGIYYCIFIHSLACAAPGLYEAQYIFCKSKKTPHITITNHTPDDRTVMVAFGYYAQMRVSQKYKPGIYFCESSKEIRKIIPAGKSKTFNVSELHNKINNNELKSLCGLQHVRTRKSDQSFLRSTPIFTLGKTNRTIKQIDITTDSQDAVTFKIPIQMTQS